jgi:acetyltransferase-like isoleucine patch superfamily enzyme
MRQIVRVMGALVRCTARCLDRVHLAVVLRIFHVTAGERLRVNGRLFVRSRGRISIGRDVRINSSRASNPIGGQARTSIVVGEKGILEIGDGARISNVSVVCVESVRVGAHVFIGGDCRIYDTDFHPLAYSDRVAGNDSRARRAAVRIGEGAFVGASCIILKGSSVGRRSVLGAGSVVAGIIPDGEIWAGNPARLVRRLSAEEQGGGDGGL